MFDPSPRREETPTPACFFPQLRFSRAQKKLLMNRFVSEKEIQGTPKMLIYPSFGVFFEKLRNQGTAQHKLVEQIAPPWNDKAHL
jgi:hypothetical protein